MKKPQKKNDEKNNSRTDWWLLSQRSFHVQLSFCKVCSNQIFHSKESTEDLGEGGVVLHIPLCSECRKRNKGVASAQRQPRKPGPGKMKILQLWLIFI